jgi:hypothetical protein
MKLKAYKSLWELDGVWRGVLDQVKEVGYAGVEYIPPANPAEDRIFRADLDALNLEFIAQVVTRAPDHTKSFRDQVLRAADLNPVLINSHSAADRMSFDDQLRFFEAALEVEQEVGIRIAHETHRGRAFFTPWSTSAVLKRLPELKVGADLSHWAVACECLPELDDPDVRMSLERAIHIHGRVGYQEGPQVPDPRAPEYAFEVERFLQLWLTICTHRKAAGYEVMTFTPEFGPAPYLHLQPFTRQPVANLWDVNLWMFQTFKTKYDELFS